MLSTYYVPGTGLGIGDAKTHDTYSSKAGRHRQGIFVIEYGKF